MREKGWRRRGKLAALALLVPLLLCFTYDNRLNESSYRPYQEDLLEVVSDSDIASEYDAIVVGTDPEGLMAAISAARNGQKVLLAEPRDRSVLGGLMTIGWLNSLDLNKAPVSYRLWKKPVYLDKGLFQEWYDGIRGTSFDVNHAANMFYRMVRAEPNIDLLMGARGLEPVMEGSRVAGVRLAAGGEKRDIRAKAVIDATQDADVAAAAGARFTLGREDLGEPDARMAVTLVIKLSGVTDEAWNRLKKHKGTGFDDRSIWGYQEAREYESSDPKRVGIRSLNMGRQDGDTLLINSMQIYGVDPLHPESLEEGLRVGRAEAPRIVDYLKKTFPEFEPLEFAGTASELYVRETRHLVGEYRLTMADLMENRDHWDAIAYGAYEVDIQSLDANNKGSIMMVPDQYGVPFRCLVPLDVDGLLVVGRSASFDTLPHGSARVMPLGMATGEAAGAAVKLASERGMTLRELSRSEEAIAELRGRLKKQGMDLSMRKFPQPEYAKHKDYKGLLAAAGMHLTIGGYSNEGWQLDSATNPRRFASQIRTMQKRRPDVFASPIDGAFLSAQPTDKPLSLEQAAAVIARAAGIEPAGSGSGSGDDADGALKALVARGWIGEATIGGMADPRRLTNGDSFMLVRDVMEYGADEKFE